ncbi:glycosyltransferase [Providencia rettgeri]|uniref:glycosyltransferase n=1 Tax=Providencia rettgeri TaxID=587 RepID=UPI00300F86A6
MKKKILIIGPWISGHIQQWLGDDTSYDYLILTCHKIKPSQKENNLKCYFLFSQIISFIFFPFFLLLNYIKFKPDIIHVHFLSSYGLLSSFLPQKKIISIWGSDFNAKAKKNMILRMIYTFILKRYDVINSPGYHITKDLISFSIPDSKILTLQYGIDLTKIEKYALTKIKKTEKVIFSSIRNWDSIYQIDKLITIWNKLRLPNSELWIFGKTENKNREVMIKKLIDKGYNIKLLGFLSHDELYKKLSSTDAFISIPKMDGTPLSVIECCYLELLPIVTTPPFYQDNIYTALDCSIPINFNEDHLSKALVHAIKILPDELKYIKAKNKTMALSNFDLFKNRKKMLELYEKML